MCSLKCRMFAVMMCDTAPKKLPPCPPLPHSHHCLHSLDVPLSMAPMLMHMRPDPNHASSLPPPHPGEPPHRWRHTMSHPMTTQDVPHSSGCAPVPLTCPAPSQRAVAIPHASHMPFMCPSPSHDLTHAPRPPSTRPDVFRRAPPLLHCHPLACPFTLSLTGYVPTSTMPLMHTNLPPASLCTLYSTVHSHRSKGGASVCILSMFDHRPR